MLLSTTYQEYYLKSKGVLIFNINKKKWLPFFPFVLFEAAN